MRRKKWKVQEMVLCGLFTALIAIGAFLQITIPVEPVPMHFTLQFYFAILAGFLLGGKKGFVSVAVYLGLGLCGVPIFASGGGPGYLLRPTFGFLIGFALTAWIVGTLTERMKPKRIRTYLAIAMAGFFVMYLSGILYFYVVSNYVIQVPVSWKLVWINCFLLTAGGDFVLCVLAAVTGKQMTRIHLGGRN